MRRVLGFVLDLGFLGAGLHGGLKKQGQLKGPYTGENNGKTSFCRDPLSPSFQCWHTGASTYFFWPGPGRAAGEHAPTLK